MNLSRILFYRSDRNADAENAVNSENNENRRSGRRRQDGDVSSGVNQPLNLDRRAANSDRRISNDHNYKGPSRRFTIDRRLNMKDRRAES